jgi:hypothetical protein
MTFSSSLDGTFAEERMLCCGALSSSRTCSSGSVAIFAIESVRIGSRDWR